MVFSSLSFLFFFLPLTLSAYYLCGNRRYRNAVLLLFSLLFYAWGEPRHLIVMLAACLIAYFGGLVLERVHPNPKASRAVLTVVVCLLLANLFFFKYLNFAADNLALLTGKESLLPRIALPIGISFYTFQILSYVIDLYRGKVAVQRSPFRFLLYACFFPQLIAGPIVRYETVAEEIEERHENLKEVSEGLKRFVLGLAKKLLIANNVAAVSELIYAGSPEVYGTAMYWLAALSFTLQLYFDFSGYSDMAIGLGRMFGFHFLENFNHPYIADSLTDFARRWHISLNTWFRDYVYIPLGGNRVSERRWMLNLLFIWGLTGLWHGASWNFLLWGVVNGLVLIAEKRFLLRWLSALPRTLRRLLTFLFINVCCVFFNGTEPGRITLALRMMFIPHATDWLGVLAANGAVTAAWLYVPLGLVCSLPLLSHVKPARSTGGELLRYLFWLGLFALCLIDVLSASYNPFIYFRF